MQPSTRQNDKPSQTLLEELLESTTQLQAQMKNSHDRTRELFERASNLKERMAANRLETRKAIAAIVEADPSQDNLSTDQLFQQVISDIEQWIRQLEDELDEYKTILDVLMDKHRTQSVQANIERQKDVSLIRDDLETERRENEGLRQQNVLLQERIQQLLTVMRMAADEEQKQKLEEESQLVALMKENEALRELLNISGGLNPAKPPN